MSKESIQSLTPDEQAQLAESMPMLLQGLETGNPAARAWLASWRSKRNVTEEAKAQAEEIRREVAITSAALEQVSLAQWCSFPTDMTRCSPFFPMNPNGLGERKYLEDYLITSANWGEIRYTGPQLSTYEEDALLVLLAILDGQSQYRERSEVIEAINSAGETEVFVVDEGSVPEDMREIVGPNLSLTYKGPLLPLLRILHGKRNPTKLEYTRFVKSLKRMTVAGLELSISTGKTKSGKRRTPRITQMSAMLAGVHWDDKKKELTATINPFFYETYMAGRVTLMDVAKRMNLKGAISKALYRFVQSQRQNLVFEGHFLTLADALNMDREQPAWKVRQQLKTAINELIRKGGLMKKSGFVEQDIIKLNRTPEALPAIKKKKTQKVIEK